MQLTTWKESLEELLRLSLLMLFLIAVHKHIDSEERARGEREVEGSREGVIGDMWFQRSWEGAGNTQVKLVSG